MVQRPRPCSTPAVSSAVTPAAPAGRPAPDRPAPPGPRALLGSAIRGRLPTPSATSFGAHRAHHPDADLDPLRRAYVLAESSPPTRCLKRRAVHHPPLAVSPDPRRARLRDHHACCSTSSTTPSRTPSALDQVGEQFAPRSAYLVDGVTKLEKVDYGAAARPRPSARSPRHRQRRPRDVDQTRRPAPQHAHPRVKRREKQERIAEVTRDVLIPARRTARLRHQVRAGGPLVFAVMHPEEYAHAGVGWRRTPPARTTRCRGRRQVRRCCARPTSPPKSSSGPPLVSVHRVSRKRGPLGGADFGPPPGLVQEDAGCTPSSVNCTPALTPVVSRSSRTSSPYPSSTCTSHSHTEVPTAAGRARSSRSLIRTHQMHKVAEAGVVAPRQSLRPAGGGSEPWATANAVTPDPARLALPAARRRRGAPDPDTFRVHSPARTSPGTARSLASSGPTAAPSACPRARPAWTPRHAQYGAGRAHVHGRPGERGSPGDHGTVLRDAVEHHVQS